MGVKSFQPTHPTLTILRVTSEVSEVSLRLLWKDPTLTLLLQAMSRPALGPEALAIASNPLREISEVFDRGLVDNSNVTPSLRGLFPLSDLWYSSQAPSHRPSTFEPCVLLMPLSRTWTASKLCRWLGGSNQRIPAPYFIRSSVLRSYLLSLVVISLNLLTQHILQVSSAGAGSFPLLRDSIFSHSLLILYQNWYKVSRQFVSFFRISWKGEPTVLHPYPQ